MFLPNVAGGPERPIFESGIIHSVSASDCVLVFSSTPTRTMFKFSGQGSITNCDGISRRDFLQAGALGAIGLTMPGFAKLKAEGKVDSKKSNKACIMIFNLGAPSQQDLWDMKPDAPSEIRGPFKPIRTKSNAFEISEILPLHAKIAEMPLGVHRDEVIAATEKAALAATPTIELKGLLR